MLHSEQRLTLGAYAPTESIPVQFSPVRLTKTRQWFRGSPRCHMFHFRQSDTSERGWWLLYWGTNGCGKAYSFSLGPRSNLLPLALWTPEPHLTLMMMFITTKTTASLTVIMFLLLSGLLFKVFTCYFWRSKEWQPTFNLLQITDNVRCL